ncbi:MAG: hypothetical protein KBC81_02760 [Candidatus Pacebacteria bacterium]|nr:hypothetical protein [Candidatus Paceibacterota bacterium]
MLQLLDMDIVLNFFKGLHFPFLNEVAKSATQAAGQAAIKTATEKVGEATPALSTLNPSSLSPAMLFAIFVIVGVLLLALTLGRTRTLISVLSIYVAFALQAMFPYFGWLLKHQSLTSDLQTLRVFVFILLYAIVFGLLNRSILKSRFHLGESSFVAVVLMGIVQLGFIVSIILNLAPSFYDIASRIPKTILPIFGNQHALFYWALIPIFLLVFQKHYD